MNTCWEFDPTPVKYPPVDRIIAIGDIHGDIHFLRNMLRVAGVIDNKDKWGGKNTYVVQIGDQLDGSRDIMNGCPARREDIDTPTDKYEGDLEVLDYLDGLDEQAQLTGGRVISLLGNHELLNIMGHFEYVYEKDLDKVNKSERTKLFKPTGKYGRILLCKHPSAVIIGSNLFVHAGILYQLLQDDVADAQCNRVEVFRQILLDTIVLYLQKANPHDIVNFYIDRYILGFVTDPVDIIKRIGILPTDTRTRVFKKIANDAQLLDELLTHATTMQNQLIDTIIPAQIKSLNAIEIFNDLIRSWYMHHIDMKYSRHFQITSNETDLLLHTMFVNRIFGFLTSDTSERTKATCDRHMPRVMHCLNISHMIIGHTPQYTTNNSGINAVCEHDGERRLIRIDRGGSSSFNIVDRQYVTSNGANKNVNRNIQVLEIRNDKYFNILYEDNKSVPLQGGAYNLYRHCYKL
jgi:hypothetical protein